MMFEDFFLEKENRKYLKYENSSELKKVFQFLCKQDSIGKMISSCKNNRPALEGVLLKTLKKNFLLVLILT